MLTHPVSCLYTGLAIDWPFFAPTPPIAVGWARPGQVPRSISQKMPVARQKRRINNPVKFPAETSVFSIPRRNLRPLSPLGPFSPFHLTDPAKPLSKKWQVNANGRGVRS